MKAREATDNGDTLESIASAHSISVAQLRALNGIGEGTGVSAGQVVALPTGSLQRVDRNGYAFNLDTLDRTHEAKGELYLANTPERSRKHQKQAGGADRLANGDGGHFIAARFGGPK